MQTWSLTANEVSGPDCICIAGINVETGKEIGSAILCTSAPTTSIGSESLTLTNGTLENMMSSHNLMRIKWLTLIHPA